MYCFNQLSVHMQTRFDPHQNNVSKVWLTLPLQNITNVHKSRMITSSRRLFIHPLNWIWMPRTHSKQLSLTTKSLPADPKVQHRYLTPHIHNWAHSWVSSISSRSSHSATKRTILSLSSYRLLDLLHDVSPPPPPPPYTPTAVSCRPH